MTGPAGRTEWVVLTAQAAFFAVALAVAAAGAGPPERPGADDFQLGLAQWEKGEFDAAVASLTRALEKHPGDANLLVTRGLIYYEQNDLDKAAADFTSVLARDKSNSRALSARARVYYEQGKLEKAMDDVTHAMAAHPNVGGRKPVLDVTTGKALAPGVAHGEAAGDRPGRTVAGEDDPFLSLLPPGRSPGKQAGAAVSDAERRAAASQFSAQNRARALQRIRAHQQQDLKNLQGIMTRANAHR
jgi:tetratricopeptide (TPR) repeat protein